MLNLGTRYHHDHGESRQIIDGGCWAGCLLAIRDTLIQANRVEQRITGRRLLTRGYFR